MDAAVNAASLQRHYGLTLVLVEGKDCKHVRHMPAQLCTCWHTLTVVDQALQTEQGTFFPEAVSGYLIRQPFNIDQHGDVLASCCLLATCQTKALEGCILVCTRDLRAGTRIIIRDIPTSSPPHDRQFLHQLKFTGRLGGQHMTFMGCCYCFCEGARYIAKLCPSSFACGAGPSVLWLTH